MVGDISPTRRDGHVTLNCGFMKDLRAARSSPWHFMQPRARERQWPRDRLLNSQYPMPILRAVAPSLTMQRG